MVIDMELENPSQIVQEVLSTPSCVKKRRGHGQTPIVDYEVRRSARLRRDVPQDHIHLDNDPRRRKGASKKYVSFSSVADLKKAIVRSSLEDSLAEFEVAPVPASTLVDLGTSFCGAPPSELSLATLL
jgi:hypothetical protein